MSEAHKGENNHFYSKHLTEEHRRKISEAIINNPKLSKKVAQYTLEGKLGKIWNSTMECGRNGFNSRHISACCRGERKTHKGFKWKYYNDL